MTANAFRLTIHTDDIAVLHCLRGLANYCQETGNKNSVVRGTGNDAWMANGHRVTFNFDASAYGEKFVQEGNRLLAGRWEHVPDRDDS